MALKLSADLKHMPKGTELEIAGLGLVKNGESVTLTEEQELDFYLRNNGVSVKDALKDSGDFKVDGTPELKNPPDLAEVSDTYNPPAPASEDKAAEDKKEVKE